MAFMLEEDSLAFPDVELSDEDGLLAVGGGLSVDRLLAAYSRGIFPWYSAGLPVLWWAPDPRFVLFPSDLHVSSSMTKVLRQARFGITFDTAFEKVIDACRTAVRKDDGTWITDAIVEGYTALHREGYAHSAEAWNSGRLVGGLYGVCLGKIFFGESMFTLEPDASKAAFITLVRCLAEKGFSVVDCQVETRHLASLGAGMIPRSEFQKILAEGTGTGAHKGLWTNWRPVSV